MTRPGDFLVTADAGKVTPAEFFNALFPGPSREERYAEHLESIIRLIEVGGSLYGKPPAMVEDARKLMAERAQLTECRGDPLLRKDTA
jgi:hypothetical protein